MKFFILSLLTISAFATEPVDLNLVTRIRLQAFEHSQAMDMLKHIAENIGPRLSGSPQMLQANHWTKEKFESLGLKAHLEAFPFGPGWSFSKMSLHLEEPRQELLLAYPVAWTAGTNGPITAEVVPVNIDSLSAFEVYQGTLTGKIILLEPFWDSDEQHQGPLIEKLSEEDLLEERQFPVEAKRFDGDWEAYRVFRKKVQDFFQKEGVLAVIRKSSKPSGLLSGSGAPRDPNNVPQVNMASHHYNRLKYFIDHGKPVKVTLDIKAQFYEDSKSYNTIAEIPGTNPKAGVVIMGAHLDSWHTGTGATDNGSSCAVLLESARILQALNIKPKRTIRFVLWSGEEQGLLGSKAYVSQHFAERDDHKKLKIKPDFGSVFAYFNLDAGAGRIRGIRAQQNAAALPILEAWMAPFKDIGAETVSMRNESGSDHLSFDRVGLPGFMFIQDPMDYDTQKHHTHLDTIDYVEEEALMQSAAVVSSILYHAAMRENMMPRKPLPK